MRGQSFESAHHFQKIFIECSPHYRNFNNLSLQAEFAVVTIGLKLKCNWNLNNCENSTMSKKT